MVDPAEEAAQELRDGFARMQQQGMSAELASAGLASAEEIHAIIQKYGPAALVGLGAVLRVLKKSGISEQQLRPPVPPPVQETFGAVANPEPGDKRPHQVVIMERVSPQGNKFFGCYPNGELRYIGPKSRTGYKHGKVYGVAVHVTHVMPDHPLAARNGQVTVYDLNDYHQDYVYPSWAEFCKAWENPE